MMRILFAVVVALVFAFVPPVHQSEMYHAFADQRTIVGAGGALAASGTGSG